jgi:hypothetical protein
VSTEIFHNIGIWTALIGTCILLAIILSLLLVVIGHLGKRVYKGITRVYALHVVWYWLERLEKEGTHCFTKADEDSYGDGVKR